MMFIMSTNYVRSRIDHQWNGIVHEINLMRTRTKEVRFEGSYEYEPHIRDDLSICPVCHSKDHTKKSCPVKSVLLALLKDRRSPYGNNLLEVRNIMDQLAAGVLFVDCVIE